MFYSDHVDHASQLLLSESPILSLRSSPISHQSYLHDIRDLHTRPLPSRSYVQPPRLRHHAPLPNLYPRPARPETLHRDHDLGIAPSVARRLCPRAHAAVAACTARGTRPGTAATVGVSDVGIWGGGIGDGVGVAGSEQGEGERTGGGDIGLGGADFRVVDGVEGGGFGMAGGMVW